MKAWIIESEQGVLIPATCGKTKSETIRNMLAWCDWYIFPDWKVLRKEGFRPVKCEINKTPSNASLSGLPLGKD